MVFVIFWICFCTNIKHRVCIFWPFAALSEWPDMWPWFALPLTLASGNSHPHIWTYVNVVFFGTHFVFTSVQLMSIFWIGWNSAKRLMSFRTKTERNIDKLIFWKGTITLICTSEGLRSDIFVITFRHSDKLGCNATMPIVHHRLKLHNWHFGLPEIVWMSECNYKDVTPQTLRCTN